MTPWRWVSSFLLGQRAVRIARITGTLKTRGGRKEERGEKRREKREEKREKRRGRQLSTRVFHRPLPLISLTVPLLCCDANTALCLRFDSTPHGTKRSHARAREMVDCGGAHRCEIESTNNKRE
jgi:hypothetical protein